MTRHYVEAVRSDRSCVFLVSPMRFSAFKFIFLQGQILTNRKFHKHRPNVSLGTLGSALGSSLGSILGSGLGSGLGVGLLCWAGGLGRGVWVQIAIEI